MTEQSPADRLRQRRIELGYSDAASAARARGWNKRTYQAHEAGTKPIGKKAQIAYARSFGLSLDYLIAGKKQAPKIDTAVEQPPPAFRYVPLIAQPDLSGVRSLKDLLALEPTEKTPVPAGKELSQEIRAFRAPDIAMIGPVFNLDTNIFKGEEVIVDARAAPEPGKAVVAILFNPTRIAIRQYGLAPAGEPRRAIIKLTPLSPHFLPETIESEEDGFIVGPVIRATLVRIFR